MQRKAYGFRDEEYLKLKILALHENLREPMQLELSHINDERKILMSHYK
jgi:hypothetical protein